MPASEYVGWIEYHNRIPFRAERLDLLMANLIALTCNINRDKDHEPFNASDFMPWMVPLSQRPVLAVPETEETSMHTAKQDAVINAGMLRWKSKLATIPKEV
jgi:hypothetical protein